MRATPRLTPERLSAALSEAGLPYYALGQTALGHEILCVELGGTREPPIVITAGSHATEWAGPLAALRLLSTLRSEHKVYLVPCRHPLGLQGFVACLIQELGASFPVANVDEAASLVARYGEPAYDEQGVAIATFGRVGSIIVDETVTRQFLVEQQLLPEAIPNRPNLIERLAGKYLFFAEAWDGNEYGWQGDAFDHPAQVLFVSPNGAVGNLNRFFNREDAPVEVACIRDLVDRVKPGLVLDLHEGFGSKFYLIIPLSDDPLQDGIVRSMTAAIRDRGFELSTFEELAPLWGPKLAATFQDLGDGIYSAEHMKGAVSLGSYAGRCCPAATTEAGMEALIAQRVDFIEWAALAAIRVYDAYYR